MILYGLRDMNLVVGEVGPRMAGVEGADASHECGSHRYPGEEWRLHLLDELAMTVWSCAMAWSRFAALVS
ncbi:MAG: hypothetical protein P9F19_13745 [Candidatus Contendobacter sp.]|nr:hypothetical protein [Candidatus Contendobacter sp.]MDG4558434.1 hypothetical protein [Candidatus Contendobacter sp.]